MEKTNIRHTKVTKKVIVVSFIIVLMYTAKIILVPLVFSTFLALLLYPVCDFFEKKLPRILSILLAFLMVFSILASIGFFFGTQFYQLFENIKDFGKTLGDSINKFVRFIENTLFQGEFKLDEIVGNDSGGFLGSSKIIENTISFSTGFFAALGLIIVYTFLFLLYRTSFEKFILYHFPPSKKSEVSDILISIQKLAQNYFLGLLFIILILGTLNGFGLWAIGFDYPFLFGYFAAFLAVIPYIGTFIGGLIPLLYALFNYDTIWMPVLVAGWYIFVQAIEGNILTPKIVGSKVSLNPLFAILALLTGGLVWGIAGMILFIPMLAIVKVIFDHIEQLKPYGLLLGSNFGNEELPFFQKARKEFSSRFEKVSGEEKESEGAKPGNS
jgi:putative heme transporter